MCRKYEISDVWDIDWLDHFLKDKVEEKCMWKLQKNNLLELNFNDLMLIITQ